MQTIRTPRAKRLRASVRSSALTARMLARASAPLSYSPLTMRPPPPRARNCTSSTSSSSSLIFWRNLSKISPKKITSLLSESSASVMMPILPLDVFWMRTPITTPATQ
ncbi:hypothetical protein D3C83_12150 [compost metagenome]